jgi:hypothetical protein
VTPEQLGQIALPCPDCGTELLLPLSPLPASLNCHGCETDIKIAGGKPEQLSAPAVCLVCNSPHFYWQKDFNQRVGCLLFGLGALFTPWTYGVSLAAMALLDFILYKILPKVSVCYICKARYRNVPARADHLPYELKTAQLWEARSENWAEGKLRPAFTDTELEKIEPDSN